eukprot:scaffold127601_cov71-Attheya_sp.AAC.1
MRMRSCLVCCRRCPAWVSWVVVILLLSDLGPLSYRAQANELLLNENVEFKEGPADQIKKVRRNRRRRRKRRSRNRKEKDEEDLDDNTGRRKRLPQGANENTTYFDLVRGGRLEKHRLRNGIDDYEWRFEYYVEFIGDLRLFNDTERDTLSLAFNESYARLNVSYSTILDIYIDNQVLTDIEEEEESSNRRLRRRSLISRFRGISLCRRCPRKRFRDPLFESRTKRRFLQNVLGDNLSVAGDLAVEFVKEFKILVITGNVSFVNSGEIQPGLEAIEEEIKVASNVPTSSSTTSLNQEPTQPTDGPTVLLTSVPTTSPTDDPTISPTASLTGVPTTSPTEQPTTDGATPLPTSVPTTSATEQPMTDGLTPLPTSVPTTSPTDDPTISPTASPTSVPMTSLTEQPTTDGPTPLRTSVSTTSATEQPMTDGLTPLPTSVTTPTTSPTEQPTTDGPTPFPTRSPTTTPTEQPTISPTVSPTSVPTMSPTEQPTVSPTVSPTSVPTMSPTEQPTTDGPTPFPKRSPTTTPTEQPTISPTVSPISVPTMSPTEQPT